MSYYTLPYSERLIIAQVKLGYLTDDFNDFAQLNGVKFNRQYLTDYQNAITAAQNCPDDETQVDTGTEKTAEVETAMDAARKGYKRAKYYVEEAYQNNQLRQNAIGVNDYDQARRSPDKMVTFLTKLVAQLNQHLTDLMGAGMPAQLPADLQTLRDELQTKLVSQRMHVSTRSQATQNRQETFAKLEAFVAEVCRAGKVIYEDSNPALFKRYLLPKTHSSDPEISVAANTSTAIARRQVEADSVWELVNTGSVGLIFHVADSIDQASPSNALLLPPNQRATVTARDISGGSFGLLVVRNSNRSNGHCRIYLLSSQDDND